LPPEDAVTRESAPNPQPVEIRSDARGNVIVAGFGNTVTIYCERAAAPPPVRVEPEPLGPNPYRGLEPFVEADTPRFFGREALVEQLLDRLHGLFGGEPKAPRWLALVGPSGAGKSSLARAGLIPGLVRRPLPRAANVALLTPGAHPRESLAGVLARIVTSDPLEVATRFELLETLMGSDGLQRIAERLPKGDLLVVVVDQLEELYSLCDDARERGRFLDNLLHAARDPSGRVVIVTALRSDFLREMQRHPELDRLLSQKGALVPAMGREELRCAIEKPAAHAGHPLAPAVVDTLTAQAEGREGALPLLQFALARIWEEGLGEGKAPEETLAKLGGVGGALASEAERLYEGLSDEGRRIARRAFLAMIRLGEGERDTRRRVPVDDVVSHGDDLARVREVLRVFSQPGTRLVMLSTGLDGREDVELTHEALLDHWGTLREWLSAGREDERFHRRFALSARDWEANGRAKSLLWRAPDLSLLRRFAERAGDRFTSLETSFYRASDELERAEGRAAKARIEGEQRAARLARAATGTLAALVVAAGFLLSSIRADRLHKSRQIVKRYEAEGRAALLDGDHGRALVYLSAAYQAGSTGAEMQVLLARALQAFEAPLVILPLPSVAPPAFSPDSQRVLTAGEDGAARIWEARSGNLLVTLGRQTALLSAAFWSADGVSVVTASDDGTARVYRAATGELRATLGHPGRIGSVSFSPDSELVVTAGDDGSARIWEAETGKLRFALAEHKGRVRAAAWSPDGSLVVTAGNDKSARIWSSTTGERLAALEGHTGPVRAVSFDHAGARVITVSDDGTAKAWSAPRGQLLGTIVDVSPAWEVQAASFRADRAALGAVGGYTWIWDARTGKTLVRMRSSMSEVRRADLSSNGARLLVTSVDGVARLWDTQSRVALATLGGATHGRVSAASLSPDGTRIVTLGADRAVRIWAAGEGQPGEDLRLGGASRCAVWSPDGERVLGVGRGGWNTRRASPFVRGSSSEDIGLDLYSMIGHGEDQDSVLVDEGEDGCPVPSPDGSLIFLDRMEGEVPRAAIVDARDGSLITSLPGTLPSRGRAPMARSGAAVVTVNDGWAEVFKTSTGASLLATGGPGRNVVSAAFHPDGERLLVVGEAGLAEIRPLANDLPPVALVGNAGEVFIGVFSANGARALTVDAEQTVRIWDAATGRLVSRAEPADGVVGAELSPGGDRAFTQHRGGAVRILDASTGKLTATVAEGSAPWSLVEMAVRPDGALLATSSLGSGINVWSAATGDLLWSAQLDRVKSLRFSPDGAHLLAAGFATTIVDLHLEKRAPAEIAALARCHVPLHLEEGRLTPAPRDPKACPPQSSDWHERSRPIRADNLQALGSAALDRGDAGLAKAYYTEGLAVCRELSSRACEAGMRRGLGRTAARAGDLDAAGPLLLEALALYRAADAPQGEAYTLQDLATLADSHGDYAKAKAHVEEALSRFRGLGDRAGQADALHQLGALAHERFHDHKLALRSLNEAFSLAPTDMSIPPDRAEAMFSAGHHTDYLVNAAATIRGQADPQVKAALSAYAWMASVFLNQPAQDWARRTRELYLGLAPDRPMTWSFGGTRDAITRSKADPWKIQRALRVIDLFEAPARERSPAALDEALGLRR
jgi:WD40 repeat protein/tetratricopeptide (TPR) repeat protein